MVYLKVLRIASISLLTLTVSCGNPRPTNTTVSLKMSEQKLNEAIYRYLSMYDEVDKEVVNEFVSIAHKYAPIFNYLTDAQTDPEFLPYLEKYSSLKMEYKGQTINTNVKILFSTHPLKTSNHLRFVDFSGYCDFFTQVVFIDRGFWEVQQDNERMRESLLFHELGHCDLNRKHFFLHENFPSYIQIENYSFMNGNIIYSLLFSLLNQSDFSPVDIYNSYSQQINIAKRDLDKTFTSMYQELFSKENTRDNFICKANGNCVELPPQDQISYSFEIENIPILKHATIGPRQGDNIRDIMTYQQLQYICYFYNQNNYKPLNDYLEEQNEMTEEEIVQYCQLNEFNN